jgi:hypothetical protein
LLQKSFLAWQWQTSCVSLTNLLSETKLKTDFGREMKRLEKSGWKISYVAIHKLQLESLNVFSLSRVRGFTPQSVVQFFFLIYEPAMGTIQHNPARLYNCDDTGIKIVQHKRTKILALKGKRQITPLQSQNGDRLWQSSCMSPIGPFIHPLLVYPSKNVKEELMSGSLPGSSHACHPSGWIQSEIFSQWFLYFIKHTKPTKEDPVILVLDGHYSHTRNLNVITLARENHVDIICLPRHSRHIHTYIHTHTHTYFIDP